MDATMFLTILHDSHVTSEQKIYHQFLINYTPAIITGNITLITVNWFVTVTFQLHDNSVTLHLNHTGELEHYQTGERNTKW